MTLKLLCERIGLQGEITDRVLSFDRESDLSSHTDLIAALCDPTRSEDAAQILSERLGEDPLGTKILTVYLLAAMKTRERYLEKGIDESIFWNTVRCFPRFIGETLERKGILMFDRASWSRRHLDMSLCRIGTLEYERKIREGQRVNAIHIPSDADFSPDALDESLRTARIFLRAHFPDFADAPITCESWLMYEGLCEVLRENSKILAFQKRFDIRLQHPVSNGYLVFIFHRADCENYQTLPENTSLQKNVKARLLSGSGIGGGFGILKESE